MARLGVSHLYASPILTARAGSMHGYDVTDPTRVNPELGGEEGFRRLVGALRMHRARADRGYRSEPHGSGRAERLVAGCAASRPGQPACAGVRHRLASGQPVAAGQGAAADAGQAVRGRAGERRDHRHPGEWRLADPLLRQLVSRATRGCGETSRNWARRHTTPPIRRDAAGCTVCLERQHYRLALWRTASDEINWRRFFDINELVGVRVEKPAVFEATHATCVPAVSRRG